MPELSFAIKNRLALIAQGSLQPKPGHFGFRSHRCLSNLDLSPALKLNNEPFWGDILDKLDVFFGDDHPRLDPALGVFFDREDLIRIRGRDAFALADQR